MLEVRFLDAPTPASEILAPIGMARRRTAHVVPVPDPALRLSAQAGP